MYHIPQHFIILNTVLGVNDCAIIVEILFFFSVSPVLDCGHTLVGGKKVVQLTCENRGGDGKFCIMRKSCWPSTTFQVYINTC